MMRGISNGRLQGGRNLEIREIIMKKTATFCIIMAGILWGLMGIFVRKLGTYGFSSLQIASIRLMGGAVIFLLLTGIFARDKLKIHLRDVPLFLGLGIGSILLFTVCYFTTISMASLAVAAILLYTSPIMVMLMSLAVFHEKLTVRKGAALGMAFAGCVLVAGTGGGGRISALALGLGLLSGFGYGLYSILGTFALRKYEPLTVTTYAFLFGGAGALFLSKPADMVQKVRASGEVGIVLFLVFLTAFLTAVLPYLLYTVGLASTKASTAAIMVSTEPVVAAVAGVVVFHETMTFSALLGILLVLGAIVILNLKPEAEACTS